MATFLLGAHFTARAGRGVKSAGDAKAALLKQAVLTNHGVNWTASEWHEAAVPSTVVVKNDDVLLACTAHEIAYVGRKVDHVRDMPTDYVGCSGAVADLLVIRPRPEAETPPVPSSFLAAFLRHDAGKHQVQRCIRGLRGGHVYGTDLERVVRVPIPPESWLKDFEAASESAEECRNEAKRVIGGAISLLESWMTA